ncbi:MAG: ABC transporter transmembrane domain-containing protein, partial [Cyclobacteriaceae bacterium]|nr:ABC transporter transmembrane domain-containing protein [Cyclobacteriaceae bacterium]
MNKKKIKKTFVRQLGQSDCGVACLVSIINFHGGSTTLDYARQLSGTTKFGTNLLGLKEASQFLGLEATGLVANSIDNLKELFHPAILPIVLENKFQHYIVFYGYDAESLVIGDPQSGIKIWSKTELEKVWQTKALLKLSPTEFLQKNETGNKLKWVWSTIKDDANILSASIFLGVVIAIFSIATAVFTQQLIDKILPSRNLTKLILGIILFSLVLLIKVGLSYIRGQFLLTQSREFNKRIIKQFYSALLFLPKSFFDSKKTGELVSRMNDTGRIQMVISNLVANVIIEFLVIVISTITIFVYSVQMGLIVLAFIPISILILFFFTKSVMKNQTEVMGLLASNESNYIDTITGIAEIKSSNKQNLFSTMTSIIYESLQKKLLDFGKIKINFSLVLELTSICIVIGSISYSSYLVLENQIKIGELVAILSLIGTTIPMLIRTTVFYVQIQEAEV